MAGSNTHTLYKLYEDTKTLTRFDFLKSVALSLVQEFVKTRLEIPNLSQDLRSIASEVVKSSTTEMQEARRGRRKSNQPEGSHERNSSSVPTDRLEKRKTCRFCPYQKKRKTAYKCIKCEEPTCLECSKKVCDQCAIK